MIRQIEWKEIEYFWREHLWPDRITPIETNSAMTFWIGENFYESVHKYDMDNMLTTPTFFGFFIKRKLIGVNSGHSCPQENNYRSRGLWVDEKYRGRGIGQALLKATIEQGFKEKRKMIWSYPRNTSWPTYRAVGFQLHGEWHVSGTVSKLGFKSAGLPNQTLNAFCYLNRNL